MSSDIILKLVVVPKTNIHGTVYMQDSMKGRTLTMQEMVFMFGRLLHSIDKGTCQ